MTRPDGVPGCPACEAERPACPDCARPVADEHDEANHNTGECGCEASLALCWRRWNDDVCCERSPYLVAPSLRHPDHSEHALRSELRKTRDAGKSGSR